MFYPARKKAGRDDLRVDDLRHTGAVLAASTGATLAELMARLGHSTPGAALRYQHAAQDRDRVIAAALSELVAGHVTPFAATNRKKQMRARRSVRGCACPMARVSAPIYKTGRPYLSGSA